MDDSSRRNFLTTAAGLAGTALLPRLVEAQTTTSSEWDLSWLDRLEGKHKQVFDLQEPDALGVVRNWLQAYQDVFGIQAKDLSPIVGIARMAFPINANDELYRRFPIGEDWKITDPETEKPALRNIFLEGGKTVPEKESTVRALQARGVIFWQCNFALRRISGMLGKKLDRPAEDIYQELRSGLLPGVIVVPAHTMLLGLAQERGCTYQRL